MPPGAPELATVTCSPAGEHVTLRAKIERGERLQHADGLQLYNDVDLLRLGRWARARKTALSGDRVFLNINCHLNLTNICQASCAYCGFARKQSASDAYVMDYDEIVAPARAASDQGVTEFHVVNGLHPRLPFAYYLRALKLLGEEIPQASIKAFTAVEVDFIAERDGRTVEAVLEDLMAAGVKSITGGGAEIFEPTVRRRIAGHKVDWERWSTVHRAAHGMGMRTSATMLYGHIEDPADRVDHVLRLRALQDETGGFDVFVPLNFQPAARLAHIAPATAAEALRVFAASRLLLDNIPHLKVFSVMHGASLSQLALEFGADDVEGTVAEYRVTPDPSGETPKARIREQFLTLIEEGGWQPVERDTRYNAVGEQASVAS